MKMKKIDEAGIGLIEVLITVLLLATALLAISTLQLRSLQFNNGAYLRSQANILVYDIIDRMRVSELNPSLYNIGYTDSSPTGNTQPNIDVREWRTAMQNIIADAKGQISCDSTRFCTISIRWEEKQFGLETDDQSTFSYTVRIPQ